jgi:hypothetical protein
VMVVMLKVSRGAVQGMRRCYELKRMEEAAAQAGIGMGHTIAVSVSSHPGYHKYGVYTWCSRTDGSKLLFVVVNHFYINGTVTHAPATPECATLHIFIHKSFLPHISQIGDEHI